MCDRLAVSSPPIRVRNAGLLLVPRRNRAIALHGRCRWPGDCKWALSPLQIGNRTEGR